MGQNASRPHSEEALEGSASVPSEHAGRNSRIGQRLTARARNFRRTNISHPISGSPTERETPPPRTPTVRPIATYSRRVSTHSISLTGDENNENHGETLGGHQIHQSHDVEHALGDAATPSINNSPVTSITASPMPRRFRLSMFRPSGFPVPRLSHQENETFQPAEYNYDTLDRTSSNDLSRPQMRVTGNRSRRSSLVGSLLHRRSRAFRDLPPRPISSLFRHSSMNDSASDIRHPSNGALHEHSNSPFPALTPHQPGFSEDIPNFQPSRRSQSIESSTMSPLSGSLRNVNAAARPLGMQQTLPTIGSPVSIESETANANNEQRQSGRQTEYQTRSSRTSSLRNGREYADRRTRGLSQQRNSIRRGIERASHDQGGRTNDHPLQDQDSPLSRVLNLAALAVASRLSGPANMTPQDQQMTGPQDLEGSLQNIVRLLQSSALQENGGPTEHNGTITTSPSSSFPLNFLRVFRVSNGTPRSQEPVASSATPPGSGEADINGRSAGRETAADADERRVTLVVVGVRSVASNDTLPESQPFPENELGRSFSLSLPPPPDPFEEMGNTGLSRRESRGTRFSYRRRSVGRMTDLFSSRGMNRRPHFGSNEIQDPPPLADSIAASDNLSATGPFNFSESPPGPIPPPSTPADAHLSPYPSGATTPIRRPASASAAHQSYNLNYEGDPRSLRSSSTDRTPEPSTSGVRHRRRSDSEFARHRDLGAGAARRNGVVGPDFVDGAPSNPRNRSWLIYIVGTNLSEDHPALTAPSLFADVSSLHCSGDLAIGTKIPRIPLTRTCCFCHLFWVLRDPRSRRKKRWSQQKGGFLFENLPRT